MATRRDLLKVLAVAAAAAGGPWGRLALAAAPGERRLVLVILRGGMDELAALAPVGDPAYAGLRGSLAPPPPGAPDGGVDLDGFFALHPALAPLAPLYREGALLPVHAVAGPYPTRSHFDAQDLLEDGGARPGARADGWLYRALAPLGVDPRAAVAVALGVPLVLRGARPVTAISASRVPQADPAFLDRLADLYRDDALLGPALAQAMETRRMTGGPLADRSDGRGPRAFAGAARTAGRLLAAADGARLAVLEMGGWDSHAFQGAGTGRLAVYLAALAEGLVDLRTALGPAWNETVILAVSEFGRTARANGTGGTDHGTGGAAFLLGGAVAGGRVLADWPGLSPARLFEGRDLAPTLEARALFKGLLRDHLGLDPAAIEERVFPDSGAVRPLSSLVRA